MEHDPLNNEEEDDEYEFQPQMNYCCGIKGDPIVSRKFKNAHTRCGFVSLVFVLKLMQMAVVAFCLYYMIADEDLKPFNIPFVKSQDVQPYTWVIFLAMGICFFNFCCARCMNLGRRFPGNVLFFIVNTVCLAIAFSGLITVDWIQPHRYIVFLIVTTIGFLCLGICVLTAVFDVEATERGIFAGLFVYFLFLFGFAHFVYVSSLGTSSSYNIEYDNFLKHIVVGGGVGLFINMVQLWYVQEMVLGRVLSLQETEFVYVSLLI